MSQALSLNEQTMAAKPCLIARP